MPQYSENKNAFLCSHFCFNYGTHLLPYLMSTEAFCVISMAPLSSSLRNVPIRVFECCNIIGNICPNIKQTQWDWRTAPTYEGIFIFRISLRTSFIQPLSERVIPRISHHVEQYSKPVVLHLTGVRWVSLRGPAEVKTHTSYDCWWPSPLGHP